MSLSALGHFHFAYKNLTWNAAERLLLCCVITTSSSTEMDLFDDVADEAAVEPHPLSDDDLPSEGDDDDDDDDDLNDTDMAPVRRVCFALSCNDLCIVSSQGSLDIKKPLAGMLPNTYDGKTAEELFPAYKPNAVILSHSKGISPIDWDDFLILARFFNSIKSSALVNPIICRNHGRIYVDDRPTR